MLYIMTVERIQDLLLQLPQLVDLYKRKETGFVEAVTGWLTTAEEILSQGRIPEVSRVASLRSTMVSAEQRVVPPSVTFRDRPSLRRLKQATAAHALRQAESILSGVISPERSRIDEALRLAKQILEVAKAKGLFPPGIKRLPQAAKVKALVQHVSQDPDLAPGIVNIKGMLRGQDYLIVLDRALPEGH